MAVFAASALAQTPPPAPPTPRPPIAAAKLASVTDKPVSFRASRVTIPPNEKGSVSGGDGILYQVSGSTEISIESEIRTIGAGDGVFIAAGKVGALKAHGGEPSIFLHFLLVPAADLNQPIVAAPATVNDLYRTANAIPDLKPGAYALNLRRITFPARTPTNAPHHRTGAAIYYVVSGTGANTIDGRTEAKGPGSFIYEPFGLVHQWGNPGDEPFTFLVFNLSPEGTPAVVPGAPVKAQ